MYSTPGDKTVTLLVKSDSSPYGTVAYNSSGSSVHNGGQLHTKMRGIYDDIGTANPKEQDLITARNIDNVWDGNGSYRNTDSLPDQYVWPLSDPEWSTINNNTVRGYGGWYPYWLRSPYNAIYAWVSDTDGIDHVYRDVTTLYSLAARPALNLNLASVLFTSAAVGGKAISESATLSSAEPTTASKIKFTVSDNSIVLGSAAVTGFRPSCGQRTEP